MTGKTLRLRRLGREGLYFLLPLDHGVSVGPVPGLRDVAAIIQQTAAAGASGFILHKGLVSAYEQAQVAPGLLLHVSASTDHAPDPDEKRIVGSVDEAVRLGADGLSVHTNFGSRTEADQLEDLGRLTTQATALGLPLLSMMYPRGPSIKDPFEERTVAHAARLAQELGADLVKTVYTGDPKSFRNVTSSVSVPVLVAGGPKVANDRDVLELVHGAMKGGAAGVSIGRNIFQHASPARMAGAVARIIFDGATVAEAQRHLREVKA